MPQADPSVFQCIRGNYGIKLTDKAEMVYP